MTFTSKLAYIPSIFVDLKLNFQVLISALYIYLETQLLEINFICYRDAVIYALSIENEGIEKGLDILSEVAMRPVISDEQVLVLYVVKLNQQACIKPKIYAHTNHFLSRSLTHVLEVFLYAYKEFHFIKILTK